MTKRTPNRLLIPQDAIACVVIVYQPVIANLQQLVTTILPQVGHLVIVDNSPIPANLTSLRFPQVSLLYDGNVHGIAGAQNKALQEIFDRLPSRYVTFLDQDSEINSTFITQLAAHYAHLNLVDSDLGAVGALPINKQTNKAYIYAKLSSSVDDDYDRTDLLINSSLFTSCATLKRVGLLDEKLFIDYVDHEWCWRATQLHGLNLYICKTLPFVHQVGEAVRRLGPLHYIQCTPFRSYYVVRNTLLLSRRSYVPKFWKVKKMIHILFMPFVFLSSQQRKSHLISIVRGWRDGILNQ